MERVNKPLEKALEAFDYGKREEAKGYILQMERDFRLTHDGMRDSIAHFLSFIAKKMGEEAVEEVLREDTEEYWKNVFMSLKNNPKKLHEFMVQAWRGHYSDFTVEEDKEKYTLIIHTCGSGGILRKKKKTTPPLYGTTKKPYPWSFNQTGIPYYCCHCGLFFNVLPREWGFPILEHHFGRQFDENGDPVDDPCRNIVYKRPRS